MGRFSRHSPTQLLAFLNNDADDSLAEEARVELQARGLLPDWATPPAAPNVESNLAASAAPIADDPVLTPAMRVGVVGPRNDDGSAPRPAPEFATDKESQDYYIRPRDPRTGQLLPSQADRAMMARGFAPVYGADGDVTYQPAAPYTAQPHGLEEDMSPWANRVALAHVRATLKPNMAGAVAGDENQPMYTTTQMDGPVGPVQVRVPTQASRARQDRRRMQESRTRLIQAAGLQEDESTEELTHEELRARARNARASSLADRRAAVVRRAQMTQNPVEYLGRDDVNDWQRMVVAERFLREGQRVTPLTVQGQNMVNAADVIKQFMTSGAGGLMDPVARQNAAMAADLARRERDPFGAGQADIAAGNWRTEQGIASLDTLAEQHDTGGLGTMSWEDADALASTLQKPPYNMRKPEAEAAAHAAAERRRWYIWGARNNTRPAPRAAPGPAEDGMYLPGEAPEPPPANPLAAPRPYG